MIGLKLGAYLNTLPAVTDKLSNRIYPNSVPQAVGNNFPRSIITSIDGNPEYALNGRIADLAKIVQVDVDAYSMNEAITIADVIRGQIEFSTDVPGDQTWGNDALGFAAVKSCTVEGSERDQDFPPKDNSDRHIFRRSIDYRVTYVR